MVTREGAVLPRIICSHKQGHVVWSRLTGALLEFIDNELISGRKRHQRLVNRQEDNKAENVTVK